MKNWFKRFRGSNLDERQEQTLLHIEANGFWLLYTLLFLDIMGKLILVGPEKWALGEMICFLVVSGYLAVRCIRNGIWDRHLKADRRTNLCGSAIAGVVVLVCSGITVVRADWWKPSLLNIFFTLLFPGLLTFTITFLLMSLMSFFYRRKSQKLEEEPADGDDEA